MSKSPLDPDFAEPAAPVAPPIEKTGDEIRKDNFIRQVLAARAPAPEPPPPPKPTERQMAQTERELAKGADRVKFSEAQAATRPPRPAPDPREGYTTPVFRPSDYQHETKGAQPFKG